MPPRLSFQGALRRNGSLARIAARPTSSVCCFCSISRPRPAALARSKRKLSRSLSQVTESATASATATADESPRRKLHDALAGLQRHAPSYINISRVELALQGLRQEPGTEAVRLAILGLGGDGSAARAAKGLLRSILADPLSSEQAWEGKLDQLHHSHPVIIRISGEAAQQSDGDATGPRFVRHSNARDGAVLEIPVSSPTLNGHSLEILVSSVGSPAGQNAVLEEAALAPAIDIPTSTTGRCTQITAPVHKALFVANGIAGAAQVAALPGLGKGEQIGAAVNLKGCADADVAGCSFIPVDVDSAQKAVSLFREDVRNVKQYETLWFASNVQAAKGWLLTGALTTEDGTTKPAVKQLAASIIRNAIVRINNEGAKSIEVAQKRSSTAAELNLALSKWAESAHSELQEQLDLAFAGRRWRKLGWWKLFWRVDDVGMLSADMISQRFLPQAERDVIFLAGSIDGSGLFGRPGQAPGYLLSAPATTGSVEVAPKLTKWPAHIGETRRYLLEKSVPALQALAQQILVQTLSTTTLTSSLGILAYLSSFGAYEAGAVAALGTVWSLRRMQTKWETAREYWQGEVREEGRKAVRAIEASVEDVLEQGRVGVTQTEETADLVKARELVADAQEALEKLR